MAFRHALALGVLLLVGLGNAPSSHATTVAYAWEGTIGGIGLPDDGLGTDPWGLGTITPYNLIVHVDQEEPGIDLGGGTWRYLSATIDLFVAGVAVPASVATTTGLTLSDFPTSASMSVGGEAEVNGIVHPFFFAAGLDPAVLEITSPDPPVFSPTLSVGAQTASHLSEYLTVNPVGSPITASVIPEPSTALLVGLGLGGLAGLRRC